MTRPCAWWVALLLVGACSDPVDPMSGAGSESSGAPAGSSETVAAESSSGAVADSTGVGDGSSGDSGGTASGVFAIGTFEIPSNATVEEFSFTATTEFNPGVLDGRELLVAITDVSHPERNQDELCPGSHPLDGCATVDYGAFGMTHDNRISFEGDGAPVVLHLYKDRSLQPEPEPLPPNE
ncbi:MAG: hypothetical protein AAF721_24415 [Myxococcota bacterium]